jgi:hypothetical protein
MEIDLKIINFAREHHLRKEKKNEPKYCVLHRELGFKSGKLSGGHLNNINMNSQDRRNDIRIRGLCVQCNIALYVEGKCFEIYHNRFK